MTLELIEKFGSHAFIDGSINQKIYNIGIGEISVMASIYLPLDKSESQYNLRLYLNKFSFKIDKIVNFHFDTHEENWQVIGSYVIFIFIKSKLLSGG
jgi:hypothetical protein